MKHYHHLNIPVQYRMVFPELPNPELRHHYRIKREEVNSEVHDWLDGLGLRFVTGEYFYTPPNRTLNPHTDDLIPNGYTKLNWMVGGEGSTMDWYELKPGASYKIGTTRIGTSYCYADPKDLILTESTSIGQPTMVHVGDFHGVRNGPHPRHVFCLITKRKDSDSRLQWDEALQIFKPFIC